MQSTKQEIDFIKEIGTFSLYGKTIPRKHLLQGYLKGCKKRKNWENIDKAIVIKFAESELSKC